LLVAAVAKGAELAIGSRYVEGGELVVEWGPVRRAVSRLGSAYARAMTGAKVGDCTSGFRCYRAASLAAVPFEDMRSDGYSFLIEVLAALTHRGAVITEVPIRYVDRRAGSSKISRGIILEALLVTTGLGFARMFRGPRVAR
jgi:dolichol-phosphate mannosyltransferase